MRTEPQSFLNPKVLGRRLEMYLIFRGPLR